MSVKSVFISENPIIDKDFLLKYYFELLPRRLKETRANDKIYKFFDYAPRIFYELRKDN
jgi:hypothetical protein